MDIKGLKCFVAVFEEKSINQAAQKLFITSQGLSRIIKNIENELEVSLFDRNQKGVFPTESAVFLYERVNLLINQLEDIQNGIRQLEEKDKKLRIACARGVLNALSFQLILDFIKDNQNIEVEWGEYANNEVKSMVASYKADVGLVVGESDTEIMAQKKLASRDITLIIYEDHPLYDREEVSIAELKDEKIIILNEKFQVYHAFSYCCVKNGFEPIIVGKTVDSNFLLKLCKLKVGIGVLIDFSTDDFNLSGVRVVKLKEKLTWDIYHICNKRNQSYSTIKTFLKYLESAILS